MLYLERNYQLIKPHFQAFLKTLYFDLTIEPRDRYEVWTLTPLSAPDLIYKTQPLILSPVNYDFSNLLNSKLFADFVITCNGQKIMAHRVILYENGGEYFKTLLSSSYEEQQTQSIAFGECSTEILNFYLAFVYADVNALVPAELDLIEAYISWSLPTKSSFCHSCFKFN